MVGVRWTFNFWTNLFGWLQYRLGRAIIAARSDLQSVQCRITVAVPKRPRHEFAVHRLVFESITFPGSNSAYGFYGPEKAAAIY